MTHNVLDIAISGTTYVDLAFEMSRTNHRLYRQGRMYVGDIIATNTMAAGAPITIETIAPTWMAQKAWQLGFKKWRESTQHERDNGIKAGRWNDFRVFFEGAHTGNPSITNGEYLYTTAEFSDGSANKQFHMIGATSGSRFGLISQYNALRDTDTDTPPSGSSSMPYAELLSELNSQQANEIQEDGDEPPYNSVDLAQTLQTFHLRAPAESNYYRTGQIMIPCGLIKVTAQGTGNLQVRMKPGKYKGVTAEAMS